MNVKPELDIKLHPVSEAVSDDVGPVILLFQDRILPSWTYIISSIFTVSSSICWIAIAVLTLFFQANVAEQGNTYLVFVLGLIGTLPILALLILDFAHNKALVGYRYSRVANEIQVRMLVAGLICSALALVHPMLAVGLFVGSGVIYLLAKSFLHRQASEPMWDFTPAEALSILSGRDDFGLALAGRETPDPAGFNSSISITSVGVLIATLATASWLTAGTIISTAAVLPIILLAYWSQIAIGEFISQRLINDNSRDIQAAKVEKIQQPADSDLLQDRGLVVSQLTLTGNKGQRPLKDIEFAVKPGTTVGIIGSVSAGKTILLRAIANPYDFPNMTLRGHVAHNQVNLWDRKQKNQQLSLIHCPAQPLLIPASGLQNLSCFHNDISETRLRSTLDRLLFSSQATEKILQSEDVHCLSGSEQKALSFARAFLLNPEVYLFDRPEDLASNELIIALSERIKVERRSGRTFLLATQNRTLLDLCDMLLVLEGGRLIDFGPSKEIRARMEDGWSRLVTENSLDAEDTLHLWLRSKFLRTGDEANRRNVCLIGSELLTIATQAVSGTDHDKIHFDFKHFDGYCCLELTDTGPAISNAQLEKSKSILNSDGAQKRQAPLAEIIRHSQAFEQRNTVTARILSVKIETYDPRRIGAGKAGKNANRS